MKRIATTAVVLALLVGATIAPAEAGKRKKKAPASYDFVARYENPAFGTGGVGVGVSQPSFVTNATNVFASVEIADDVSPIGYAEFSWDTDGNGIGDTGVVICGATDSSVELPANTSISVFMWAAPSPFCAGFSTSGTLKTTLSSKP